MTLIKSKEDIEKLRIGGKHLCEILIALGEAAVPGVETKELNNLMLKMTKERGLTPSILNYQPSFGHRPYPAGICASVNDVVVHGIPNEDNTVLKDGDVISIDTCVTHQELVSDSCITVPVGNVSPKVQKLISVTKEARKRGIEAAQPGGHVGDIGHAIESYIDGTEFQIVKEFCGHGVGHAVHEPPNILHFGKPGTGAELVPGMVITIEPILTEGSPECLLDEDGYTVRTKDGSWSAQFEHTVLITDEGHEILTEC